MAGMRNDSLLLLLLDSSQETFFHLLLSFLSTCGEERKGIESFSA